MRYLFGMVFVLALGLMGCNETAGTGGSGGVAGTGGDGGVGGEVIDAIEEMMVGRWWLDWDKSAANTAQGIGLATFTADGWANYDVEFPTIPGVTEWCRRYADWSLFDVVSETEFGYALTYTHDICIREAGQAEQFKVVLDQMDPPKGEVTRLAAGYPAASGQWTLPIERCTTDITASVACGFEDLDPPMQNPCWTGGGVASCCRDVENYTPCSVGDITGFCHEGECLPTDCSNLDDGVGCVPEPDRCCGVCEDGSCTDRVSDCTGFVNWTQCAFVGNDGVCIEDGCVPIDCDGLEDGTECIWMRPTDFFGDGLCEAGECIPQQ